MTKLRIGTWNLENLFRPGGPSGPADDGVYREKLDSLAATITELNPDVLAVQEVGDTDALDDLAQRIGGRWFTYLANGDSRGIAVGYLSRPELTNIEQVAEFPTEFTAIQGDDTSAGITRMPRPALAAELTTSGRRIGLLSCHFKSKLLTFPGGRFTPKNEDERARYATYALHRRAAEAATVRTHATSLLTGRVDDVIVLGDLNDTTEAATTQILQGPPGSEIGTRGYDQPDNGDPQRLWNLAPRIPEPLRYSRIYRGRRELIDHILASRTITNAISDGDVITAGPTPASITDNPTQRRNTPASDHRPLLATITLPPA
ncbi:MAG: endonuclease/exonuclease/phosphatase family protein [Nocardioides sp.]